MDISVTKYKWVIDRISDLTKPLTVGFCGLLKKNVNNYLPPFSLLNISLDFQVN